MTQTYALTLGVAQRIFNIANKGRIVEGWDVDLTLTRGAQG